MTSEKNGDRSNRSRGKLESMKVDLLEYRVREADEGDISSLERPGQAIRMEEEERRTRAALEAGQTSTFLG